MAGGAQRRLELVTERRGGCGALCRILGQSLLESRTHRLRHTLRTQVRWGLRRDSCDHRGERVVVGVADERRPTGDQRVDGRCERIDIRCGGRWLAVEQLRGGMRVGGGDDATSGLVAALEPSDPEVGQLRLAVCRHQDVLGFDVSVEDAELMGLLERSRDPDPDRRGLRP